MDFNKIELDVYHLAHSDDPLAPAVREALDVIEEALNTYGYVAKLLNMTCSCSVFREEDSRYRSASTAARTVRHPFWLLLSSKRVFDEGMPHYKAQFSCIFIRRHWHVDDLQEKT